VALVGGRPGQRGGTRGRAYDLVAAAGSPALAVTRRTGALAAVATALGLVLLGLWLMGGFQPPLVTGPGSAGPPVVAGVSLDDMMQDLQILTLGGEPAPAFILPTLDGKSLALADLAGRPALLYFWATW
jgi:hypothetical protein